MKPSVKEKQVLAKIAELERALGEHTTLLREVRANRLLECPHCNKRSPISKWGVIRDHSYTPPRGCMEGDYWSFSNEYHILCPKCQGMGRVWLKSYDPPEHPMNQLFEFIKENYKLFGEQLDNYEYGTIEQIREKNKQREKDRDRFISCVQKTASV
jgi:hypothetical protein